jgi:acetyl esterase
MSNAASSLSEGMRAFIRTATSFSSSGGDWPSRRAAFARQCAHFTQPARRPLVATDQFAGGVMTRCIRPAAPSPRHGWPVLVYLHGGGWTMGSHTTHDWFAHALLERVDVAVVLVDYRLAPEASFPAPLDDALAVWNALGETSLPLDLTRRAVAGDSAGGTLAAALCVLLDERHEAQPDAQALLFPVVSADQSFASMEEHAEAPMLSARGLADSIALYLPDEHDRRHARAMPLECDDLSRLAPAFVAVAIEDVLCDQGIEYAVRLRNAGVKTDICLGHGLVHGSLRAARLDEVAALYDRLAGFLKNRGVADDRAGE